MQGEGGERKKPLVIPCPFTAQKGHYSSPIGFDYCVLEQLGYTLDCLFSRLLLDYDHQKITQIKKKKIQFCNVLGLF